MIRRVIDALVDVHARQRLTAAIAKGSAARSARALDLARPATWEFSGFSQNGEDGVIEVLRRHLHSPHRYFVEIGSADGIANNTAWLAVVEGLAGLMVEGDPDLAARADRLVPGYSVGAEVHNLFVSRERAPQIRALAWFADPDVFSLDIDGNDYYVAQALLEGGFRPGIAVVEYNSAFGPERSATIEYREDFAVARSHPGQLYFGVSIAAWRKLFSAHGYRFVTVEQNGVNAFFVDPARFDAAFLERLTGLGFAENRYLFRKTRLAAADQFALIADRGFVTI